MRHTHFSRSKMWYELANFGIDNMNQLGESKQPKRMIIIELSYL